MNLHVIVPAGIDDPSQPSGGNRYDRRICDGLAASGWTVHEHPVGGPWPRADGVAIARLRSTIAAVPDGALVVVDGLIVSAASSVLVAEALRLQLIVLVHMPLDADSERAVLSASAAVITTSSWTRDLLLDRYALAPDRVHIATPGVDPAELAEGTTDGAGLLCVGAVTPVKGHDDLFAALATLTHLPWHCVCVGSIDRDRPFVERLGQQLEDDGIGDRVCFRGPSTGAELDRAYATADLLVLASRSETYGMVVSEALARGLPVLATAVGGVAEALGQTPDGCRPGVLVSPSNPPALATAVDAWLTDADLRQRLRHAAEQRRVTLTGWSTTADQISRVLTQVARA